MKYIKYMSTKSMQKTEVNVPYPNLCSRTRVKALISDQWLTFQDLDLHLKNNFVQAFPLLQYLTLHCKFSYYRLSLNLGT